MLVWSDGEPVTNQYVEFWQGSWDKPHCGMIIDVGDVIRVRASDGSILKFDTERGLPC